MSEDERLRALIVEDEPLVLVELALTLGDLGYNIVGSAADLEAGLALTRELAFNFAVLDFNLGGGKTSAPIADALTARSIPFLFASGYTSGTLPDRHKNRPLLAKPYDAAGLKAAIKQVVAGDALHKACRRR